jgi:hypothetical protein
MRYGEPYRPCALCGTLRHPDGLVMLTGDGRSFEACRGEWCRHGRMTPDTVTLPDKACLAAQAPQIQTNGAGTDCEAVSDERPPEGQAGAFTQASTFPGILKWATFGSVDDDAAGQGVDQDKPEVSNGA